MDLLRGVSATGGAGLAGMTRAVAAVRTAAKPLHPRGALTRGELRRTGEAPPTGIAWLDEAGVAEVMVRRSRAVGWPRWLPDVHGMALRVDVGEGYGDLLLATTGLGRGSRFLLLPGWDEDRPVTTLLPYRSPSGPLFVAARRCGEGEWELRHAIGIGPWHRFAVLTISSESGPDPLVSFDPVRNVLPGLRFEPWVERLREPAYFTARRSRSGR